MNQSNCAHLALRTGAALVMRYFRIEVMYNNPARKGGPFSLPFGQWTGLAKDAAAAEALAHAECWPSWLNDGTSIPVYDTKPMPRYTSSAGWDHIFVGNRQETTRWIYDRATRSLVTAQVLNGRGWITMEMAPAFDLLESLHHNGADEDSAAFNLAEWNEIPTWTQVEATDVADELLV